MMKNIIIPFVTILLLYSCGNRQEKYTGPLDSNNFVTIDYYVAGLDSIENEKTVETALLDQSGVYSASASFDDGIVRVVYDKKHTNPKFLVEAIESNGCMVDDFIIIEDRTIKEVENDTLQENTDTIIFDNDSLMVA